VLRVNMRLNEREERWLKCVKRENLSACKTAIGLREKLCAYKRFKF